MNDKSNNNNDKTMEIFVSAAPTPPTKPPAPLPPDSPVVMPVDKKPEEVKPETPTNATGAEKAPEPNPDSESAAPISDATKVLPDTAAIEADAQEASAPENVPPSDSDDTEDVEDESEGDDESDELDDDYDDDEYEDERPAKKRKKRRHNWSVSIGLILTMVVVEISVILAIFIIIVGKDFAGIGKSDTLYVFEVEEGATTASIAQQLNDEGFINAPTVFRIISRLSGNDGLYKAGIHYIRPSMSYEGFMEELTSLPYNENEKLVTVTITFPEGTTLADAAKLLDDNGVCDSDKFIYVFNSSSADYRFDSLISSNSLKFYKKEGFFFPDTYEFYEDEDPEEVCSRVLYNFDQKFKEEYYERLEELDMTLDELITLASIIQAEAGNIPDMKKVSSVFHNRLDNPMQFPMLQSDPTSNYVSDVIKANAQLASSSVCTAYDTYLSNGLPPGAICNPGADAIEAALYPADTNYFYFCSDLNTREFFYAETLSEHNENLRRANLVE